MNVRLLLLLVLSVIGAQAQQFTLDGVNLRVPNRKLLLFGDSFLTVGFQNQWLTNQSFFGQGTVSNMAVSGTYTYDIEIAISNRAPDFRKTNLTDEIYCLINGGGNNLSHSLNNLAQMQNNMSNAWSYATNAGFQLIVATINPGSSVVGNDEVIRLQYNNWVRSNYLAWGARIFDIAKMFPATGDTSIYYDANHPTTNAGIQLGKMLETVIKEQGFGQPVATIRGTNNSWVWRGLEVNSPIYIGVGGRTNISINVDGSVVIGTNIFY